MNKCLVLYYSKTGNSQFIAQKLSHKLNCDLKRINPLIDNILFLFILSLLKIGIPIRVSKKDISEYSDVIIIGPVWGGLVISPLKTALKKCSRYEKNIHFAVTCETKDEDKDKKYGYSFVLKKAERLGGQHVKNTEAFSTSLVNHDNKLWSPKLSEKIKITEENYSGILKQKVETFAAKINIPLTVNQFEPEGRKWLP